MGGTLKKSVVVVDDQLAFAEALGLAISLTDDFVCVATADAMPALSVLQAKHTPALFVVAYRSRGATTGLEAAKALRQAGDRTPLLLLTPSPAPAVVSAGRDLRNIDVASKCLPMRDLIEQMRRILDGRRVDVEQSAFADPQLSPRELNVLLLLGEGRRAVEIAEELNLSIHTVRDHIKEVLSKLDADTQLKAVLKAQRIGVLTAPYEGDL